MDILNGHVKKSDRNNSVFDWNNAGVPTLTYITMADISELPGYPVTEYPTLVKG